MEYKTVIQDVRTREQKQAHRLNLVMIMAGLSLILTIVTSAPSLGGEQMNSHMLTDLSMDNRDIKLSMKQEDSSSAVRPKSELLAVPTVREIQTSTSSGLEEGAIPPGSWEQAQHSSNEKNSNAGMTSSVAIDSGQESVMPIFPTSYPVKALRQMDIPLPHSTHRAMTKQLEDVALTNRNYSADDLFLYESKSASLFPDTRTPKILTANRDVSLIKTSFGQKDEVSYFKSNFTGGQLFTLDNTFTQQYLNDNSMQDTDQGQGFWSMKLSSKLLGPSLIAEFATSSFNTDTGKNFASENYRMLKLATQSSWMGFNIGAGYQSSGDSFEELKQKTRTGKRESKNDRKDNLKKGLQGTEIWAFRKFGNIGVKTFASQYTDNPDEDENIPGYTTQKIGGAVDYFFSNWPQLGFSMKYGSGSRSSSNEPAGYDSIDADIREIETTVNYAGGLWSGSLFFGNSRGATETNLTDIETYYAEASYLPFSTVSISPSISYVREKYPEFNLSTDSLSTAMSVSYKPTPNGFNYSLYSEYSTNENLEWGIDNNYLYTSLGAYWDSEKPKSLIKQWSLELFYDQYADNIVRDSNVGGLGFMLNLRSSPMAPRLFVNEVR